MKSWNLRSICRAAAAFAVVCTAGAAHAAWPERPIRLIVPYPAGGLTDVVTRTIGDEVGRILGQPLVIENRAGAGGKIGLDAVKRADKDGYTNGLVVPATMVSLPLVDKNFGLTIQDFDPITIAIETYSVLVVNPASKITKLSEFVEHAKRNPGKLNYGTPGAGTTFHFNTVNMERMLGIQATHVPYKGEGPVLNDLAGGQIDFMIATNSAKAYIDSGRLVALAVGAAQRVPVLPNVPTFRELGIDFTTDGWVGYVAPAGLPADVLQKLNGAFVQALKTPAIQAKFRDMGYNVVANSPQDFRKLVEQRSQRYADLIRSGAVKIEN
ncbi:MAG: Bug family tripartite tricarboxylate transporter substrate binding protein [Burkholderiaceae bacterium]